jgi:hypothetical protein
MASWNKPGNPGIGPGQSVAGQAIPPVYPPLAEDPLSGTGESSIGVSGQSNNNIGVSGQCLGTVAGLVAADAIPPAADGVLGIGKNGVHGQTYSATDHGVFGENLSRGAAPTASAGSGVCGTSKAGFGVIASSGGSYGLYAVGARGAASFAGDITINGNIASVNTINVQTNVVLNGGDCAEHFDVADEISLEPGTVVVLDQDGAVRESRDAYDKKVAGVVSGAGDYRPAIVLDRRGSNGQRTLVALVGKVYCKVDASMAPIDVGDLLTASSTPGHAMKASDQGRVFGAVIGKALKPLQSGKGLIPILVALQ